MVNSIGAMTDPWDDGIFTPTNLPETNSLHLKINGWKMKFLLGWSDGLFAGASCGFRECYNYIA